jgi:hypothetical protein
MTNVKITPAAGLPIFDWMSTNVEIDVMNENVATFVNAQNYVLKDRVARIDRQAAHAPFRK